MIKKIIFSSLPLALCLIIACKNEPKSNANTETTTQATTLATTSVDSTAIIAQTQTTADSMAAAKAKMSANAKNNTTDDKKGTTAAESATKAKPKMTTVTPVKSTKMTTVIKPEPKFDDNKVIKRVGKDDVFIISEIAPAYIGGEKAMMKYLQKNIKYPTEAKEKGIKGTVFVEFVVEKNGIVDDVLVKKGVDPLLDKEAVRVVTSMPKWMPGKQNGNLVAVRYNIPVKFEIITN